MKTTVEITDSLLEQARRQAAREGATVRALIEEGLRKVLAEREKTSSGFKMRKVSVGGEGLNPALAQASWDGIRDLIYDGQVL